jgi:hypothetical protein
MEALRSYPLLKCKVQSATNLSCNRLSIRAARGRKRLFHALHLRSLTVAALTGLWDSYFCILPPAAAYNAPLSFADTGAGAAWQYV